MAGAGTYSTDDINRMVEDVEKFKTIDEKMRRS
jgi:hypothetical protein